MPQPCTAWNRPGNLKLLRYSEGRQEGTFTLDLGESKQIISRHNAHQVGKDNQAHKEADNTKENKQKEQAAASHTDCTTNMTVITTEIKGSLKMVNDNRKF